MTAASSTHDAPETSSWSRGQVGTLSLILAETSFFGVFLVAYLFYIGKSATGPQPADVLDTPWLASVCLLSSSATIVLATRALGAGAIARFTLFLGITVALGGSFLFLTGLEWRSLIVGHGLAITTNLFGTTYYSLVGFHAAHVAIGLFLMSLVLVLSLRGHLAARYAERVEMLSWYWHFVDVVWIFVFTVVYVVGV
jgi:cytochrome c oxidase subunit 3